MGTCTSSCGCGHLALDLPTIWKCIQWEGSKAKWLTAATGACGTWLHSDCLCVWVVSSAVMAAGQYALQAQGIKLVLEWRGPISRGTIVTATIIQPLVASFDSPLTTYKNITAEVFHNSSEHYAGTCPIKLCISNLSHVISARRITFSLLSTWPENGGRGFQLGFWEVFCEKVDIFYRVHAFELVMAWCL